jgi:putative ABC transport system permease protein
VGRFRGQPGPVPDPGGWPPCWGGGIGVAGAVRSFLARKGLAIAAMKSGRVAAPGVRHLSPPGGSPGPGGSLLGLAGAWGPASSWGRSWPRAWKLPLEPGLHPAPAHGPGFGLLTALAFALPPLSAAARVSPARLLPGLRGGRAPRPHAAPGWPPWGSTWPWPASPAHRAQPLRGPGLRAGTAFCALASWPGRLVRWAAGRCPRLPDPRLRQAVAGLHRPGASTGSVLPAWAWASPCWPRWA